MIHVEDPVAARAIVEESPPPLISVQSLRVDYPTPGGVPKHVLKGIDLNVMPGEIMGLVGESGAGKTTLARSVLGLPPMPGRIVEGRVIFEGRDVLSLPKPQLRRLRGHRLSMVVPNPRGELNPVLTVGEQIANMARVHLDRPRLRRTAWRLRCSAPSRFPIQKVECRPIRTSFRAVWRSARLLPLR